MKWMFIRYLRSLLFFFLLKSNHPLHTRVCTRAPLPVELEQDYQHLYYGGLSSTLLAPPAGEEVLLEVRGEFAAVQGQASKGFVSNDVSAAPLTTDDQLRQRLLCISCSAMPCLSVERVGVQMSPDEYGISRLEQMIDSPRDDGRWTGP